MSDPKSLAPRRSRAVLCCYYALGFNLLLTGSAAAVTGTELQRERATLKAYEQRIPDLLTDMRILDHRLETLQQQRETVEQSLNDLTRTYLTKHRAHEKAQAKAAATDDKNTQAELEHARFQYFLVERKLTNLQNEAEQLDKDIAPLKQSLKDKQRQLQQNEKRLADQREYVRKLASANPTTVERIEIRSSDRTTAAQPGPQANLAAVTAASVPPNSSLPSASNSSKVEKVEVAAAQSPPGANRTATTKEWRYANTQARRLQELLATEESDKTAGARPKTLEVQHRSKPGVKHLYDLAYVGANHYTANGTVHAGKQVFKVAKQRWITTIPAHDDGANYVFVLNATPHRRLELIMYNSALVE